MPDETTFQGQWGTALATFTQTGTFSAVIPLSKKLLALYSDNFPSAAGSIVLRASANPSGTGWPIITEGPVAAVGGTTLKILSFGSGTYYDISTATIPIPFFPYLVLQIGTAGTAGVAAGGTIVLVTGT